jgi:hypothetical protein
VKNTLTQCSAVVLLPIPAGAPTCFGAAPTMTRQQGTAVPSAARLRVPAAVDLGFGAVDAAPPPRGAPV